MQLWSRHCRRVWMMGIAIALTQAIACPAWADSSDRSNRSQGMSIPAHVSLPVTATELVGGANTQAIPIQSQRQMARSATPLTITRSLPALWRMRIPTDQSAADLVVSYTVVGANGEENCLSHPTNPESYIRVRFQPMHPTVAERDRTTQVIEGGVIVQLDASSARYSGNYQGTIRITINRL